MAISHNSSRSTYIARIARSSLLWHSFLVKKTTVSPSQVDTISHQFIATDCCITMVSPSVECKLSVAIMATDKHTAPSLKVPFPLCVCGAELYSVRKPAVKTSTGTWSDRERLTNCQIVYYVVSFQLRCFSVFQCKYFKFTSRNSGKLSLETVNNLVRRRYNWCVKKLYNISNGCWEKKLQIV